MCIKEWTAIEAFHHFIFIIRPVQDNIGFLGVGGSRMEWTINAICFTIAGVSILFILYLFLFLIERKPSMALLSVSWISAALMYCCVLLQVLWGQRSTLIMSELMFLALCSVFLLWGVHEFLHRPMERSWLVVCGGVFLYMLAAMLLNWPLIAMSLPFQLLCGSTFVWSGISFVKVKGFWKKPPRLVGISFILMGVYQIIYPFIREARWFNPLGHVSGTLLLYAIAFGIIYLHFDRIRNQLQKSETYYRLLAENVKDMIYKIRIKPELEVEYVSPAVEEILGYSPQEYYADRELIFRTAYPEDLPIMKGVFSNTSLMKKPVSLRCFHKNGSLIWVEIHNTPVYDKNGELIEVYGVCRNITRHKWMVQRLVKLNRLNLLLSKISHVYTHVHDLETLYQEACRIAVEERLLKMAWVGLLDPDSRMIRPVAHFGVEDGYLENICITLDDVPEGHGPIAEAVRGKKYFVVNDIAKDDRMLPWRDAALQRGYRSVAAFPLIVNGNAIGTMGFYAGECNFFNHKEIGIFRSLVNDVSFGIEAIIGEKRRRSMAEALRASRERYRTLINVMPDAVFIHQEGKLVFVNDAALKLLGLKDRDEIIGREVLSFIDPGQRHIEAVRIQNILDKKGIDPIHEEKLITAGGKTVDVEIIRTFFRHGDQPAILSIARDITRKKRIEALKNRLKEKNKRLEEALEYDRIRSEFFANISHEFRTPLNIILGSIQLLLMYDRASDDKLDRAMIRKYIHIMRQNCYRLLRLVNNLIDITKIDAGYFEIHLDNYDIVSVVEDITLSVASYIENKGIKLVFDTDVEEKVIACDPEKIERVMLNLLSNAVKFTPAGGNIEVNIEDRGDKVFITVKDDGFGIPEDKLDIIFERFRQVDKSLTRNSEGSGIGLSLVKSLVNGHGGRVWAESEYGKGSRFIVELPAVLVENSGPKVPMNMSFGKQDHVEKINIEFSDIYEKV